jgi:hypothetical protein
MKQDLPSYIANDAAPLFPDVSAMTDEEFNNYESPPERLAFYRLHTEEGLKAFLYDVYWIGYPGLFIAVNHVWNLLIPPRAYHCTLMGQMSGAGGAGKQALVNTLKQFIGEALETFEYDYPAVSDFESLEAWHNHCMAMNMTQDERVHLLVAHYAAILNGEPVEQVLPDGTVLRGPWKPLDPVAAFPVDVSADRAPGR